MKIAICAALYEAGRPFLAPFVEALRAATAGRDVVFVAAVDGLRDAKEALAELAGQLDIIIADVPAGHTLAGVRRAMLAAGQASGADVLVFIDMDDLIAPGALDRHLGALEEADFSYGDMDLIDDAGHGLERRFFDNAGIPDRVDDVITIRDRNFLGFSNTAVRANRLSPDALIVPEDVVAADWWFFTMLVLAGLRGKKTAGTVAAYRIHDSNTLGVGAPQTVPAAIIQAEAMLRHYRAFSAHPALAGCADETGKVLEHLRKATTQDATVNLSVSDVDGGAWFEGIGHMAKKLTAARQTDAVAQ